MNLNKTEKSVLIRVGGWHQKPGIVKHGKRWDNAIKSLKNKGLLIKEPDSVYLKFSDTAWNNMPQIKKILNVISQPVNF